MIRTDRFALIGAVLIAAAWLTYGIATVSEHGVTLDETSIFYAGDRTLFFLSHPDVPGALDFRAPGEPAGFSSRFARFPDFADPWHYPVLPGLLMAVSNLLFGQRLSPPSDIDGHHLGLIFLHAVGLFAFAIYACRFLGTRAGLLAAATYALYPTIVGFAFNNPKDLPATDFYGVSVLAAGAAFRHRRPADLWAAGLLCGVSLAAKINGAFAFITIALWALLSGRRPEELRRLGLWRPLWLFPAVAFGVFFVSWPWFWDGTPIEWVQRVFEYVRFYGAFAHSARPGFTAFPVIAVLAMTPPLVLCLAALGVWKAFATKGDLRPYRWLLGLWFLIPLLRIALPHSEFYDANRHFIEYIGGLCAFAGLGAALVLEVLAILPAGRLLQLGAVAAGALILWLPLAQYRPYEGAYFNSLVGGLGGAKRQALFYMQAPPADSRESGSEGDFWNGSLRAALRFVNANVPSGASLGVCGPATPNLIANLEQPPTFRLGQWTNPKTDYVYLMGRECYCPEADIRSLERQRPILYRVERGGALIDEVLGPPLSYPVPSVTQRTRYATLPHYGGGRLIPARPEEKE